MLVDVGQLLMTWASAEPLPDCPLWPWKPLPLNPPELTVTVADSLGAEEAIVTLALIEVSVGVPTMLELVMPVPVIASVGLVPKPVPVMVNDVVVPAGQG